VCDPENVCLFDTARGVALASTPALLGLQAFRVAFSPSGDQLAVLSTENQITVFDIRDPARPVARRSLRIKHGAGVEFADEATLAVLTNNGMAVVPFAGQPTTLTLPDRLYDDVDSQSRRIVVGSLQGSAVFGEGAPWHVAARAQLCNDAIAGVRLIPHRREIAYACKEGTVGLWSPDHGMVTPRFHTADHADLVTVSPDGEYVIVSGGKANVYVLDLTTDLLATYHGPEFRPTVIIPPTAEAPFVISGDARGAIRMWPLPSRIARVATTVRLPFHNAFFNSTSSAVIATSFLEALTVFSPTSGARQVAPHEGYDVYLAHARDRNAFATYGLNDLVERWSVDRSDTLTRAQVIQTPHGSVNTLAFLDRDDFVTAGNDGQLMHWATLDGVIPNAVAHGRRLAQLDRPIDRLAFAPISHTVVFAGRDGSLWQLAISSPPEAAAVPLRTHGAQVTQMIASPDGVTVYAGFNNGEVLAIDTDRRQIATILHAASAIRTIDFTPDATTFAVATTAGMLHIANRVTATTAWDWRQIELHTVHHALTADGILVAAGNDGTIWLYAIARDRWLCLPVGMDLRKIELAPNNDAAISLDLEGRLIWIDLAAARKQLASPR
jgi:WD40 repeat protein